MKCDELKQEENPIEWGLYYDKNEVDAAITELKCELSDARDDARSSRNLIDDKNEEIKELEDKVQQKDFFWDGCCFSKMGFKNTIDVANYVDSLKAENRKLKRALWLTRADRAKAIQWHEGLDRYLQERKAYWPSRFCFMANDEMYHVWYKCWCEVERKCRAKAEEYK